MARQYAVDDSDWMEVKLINGYALFMGYLMIGVRGLGLLVITWTTVVLLGGFVSDLEKNDFWCLTGITLIQVAGVFNFLLSEKLTDMVHLSWGLLGAAAGTVMKEAEDLSTKRIILAYAASAIQGVVLFVVLCPVAILYVFGLGISAGASLWRLIKHDFGDDGGANKKPALQVLYSLAVAQGVLFGYKMIHAFVAKGGLVKLVYNRLDEQVHEKLVAKYLEETVAGCEKDPSFATGRNFVTYGVDLMMEAKSSEGFIAGIKVLGGAIDDRDWYSRKVVLKHLLTRPDCSSYMIQRLLETVGPTSPYSREIKEHAVRILDIIARCIPLEQLPRVIECLCSVVDTYEDPNKKWEYCNISNKDYGRVDLLEEYEKMYLQYRSRTWENEITGKRTGFDQLLVIAANIIYKLVTDMDNRGIMRTCVSNTMLHKIAMFPIKLHRDNHDPCPCPCGAYVDSYLKMLEQCWALTERLLVALTETSRSPLLPAATLVGEGRQRGRRRSKEIEEEEEGEEQLLLRPMDGSAALGSSIKCTIKDSIESTIRCIFDCLDCEGTVKRQAIQILLHLSWDMSFIIKDDSQSSKRRLRWVLLFILCSNNDDSKYWMVPSLTHEDCCDFDGIRRLAGEKLSEMLQEKKHELPSEETATELQLVGLALEDLRSAFFDDPHDVSIRTHAIIIMEGLCRRYYTRFPAVGGFLVDAIPEVVKETLSLCGSKTAERQGQATDVEKGNVSQDNQDGCIDTRRLRKALVLLCLSYSYGVNHPLRSDFKKIASKTCKEQGKSFGDFMKLLQFYKKFT